MAKDNNTFAEFLYMMRFLLMLALIALSAFFRSRKHH